MRQQRVARGIPTGGQFTAKSHAEVELSLTEPEPPQPPPPPSRYSFSDDVDSAANELLDMENAAYEKWRAAGEPDDGRPGTRRWSVRARQERHLPQKDLDRRQHLLRGRVRASLESSNISGDVSDRAEKIAETMGLETSA